MSDLTQIKLFNSEHVVNFELRDGDRYWSAQDLAIKDKKMPLISCPYWQKKGGDVKSANAERSGSWIHEELVVAFARWLDPAFAVACDQRLLALNANHITSMRLTRYSASHTTW